jgi:membrane-associated protease RseP (regulator of RpoE activity)
VKGTDPGIEETTSTSWARLAVLAAVVVVFGARFGLSVVFIVVALVVMIFLHELGHYLTAKWAGMKVTEFFLGFGPKIWSFQRGETEYGVKAIPAGAYVKIIGMNNLDEVDPVDEDRTYRSKPTWRRLSVAVAGSTMHFLIAFVLICIVVMGFGMPKPVTTLASVSGPAHDAGLHPDDTIVSIDGQRVSSWDQLTQAIRSRPGQTVALGVQGKQGTRTVEAHLADQRPDGTKVGYLGIGPALRDVRHGPWEAVKQMGSAAKESVIGLGHLFSPKGVSNYVDNLTSTTKASGDSGGAVDRPSSVVGIVEVGKQAAENGVIDVLYLLFAFNMFIGIFNLTPLLPFDGGHVVIALYEQVRSTIAGRRYQADVAKLLPVTYAVVLVLAFLFVTTLYMDIVNPVSIR